MINHIRTLLMNRSPAGYGAGTPGEEFVEPAYQERVLPNCLLRVHHRLYGRKPDRLFMNYRLRQLMALIHSTELDEYARLVDPRITYWPTTDDVFLEGAFTTQVSAASGSGQLFGYGQHTADEANGRCLKQWQITVANNIHVTVSDYDTPQQTVTVSYTTRSGLSSAIPLAGTRLNVRFRGTTGDSWIVRSTGRPATDIGTILATMSHHIGDATIAQVFKIWSDTEQTNQRRESLWNIWRQHPLSAYSYAALLLAVAELTALLPAETPRQFEPPVTLPAPSPLSGYEAVLDYNGDYLLDYNGNYIYTPIST